MTKGGFIGGNEVSLCCFFFGGGKGGISEGELTVEEFFVSTVLLH